MLQFLIHLAEVIVAIDVLLLAALVVARRLAERRDRRSGFAEVLDFARWNAEVESWMAGSR